MKSSETVSALGALAHEHRLAVYRLLVERGPAGLPAGAIATKVGLVPSSLTFHLQALQRAGLISQRRESRQLFYAADFDTMSALVDYLAKNCCGGTQDCATGCAPASVANKPRARSRKAARAPKITR